MSDEPGAWQGDEGWKCHRLEDTGFWTGDPGSLLYLVILLAASNIEYGLPSVTNNITSN